MTTRILVTGASGFAGRKIIRELLKQDTQILALDRMKADFADNRVTFSNANLLDKEALKKDITAFNPTAVLHLAAIASPVYGNVAELYDVNVHGSENLLDVLKETCKAQTRAILVSTAGVYGNSGKDYITEDTPYNPQNHYSFSKMIMEYISKSYPELDIHIVRPFNMIGVGQNANFLVPKLVNAFKTKQDVLEVGNLDTYRDFVDIDFSAKFFAKILLSPHIEDKILNICAGHGTKGSEIIQILAELTGHMPEVKVNPAFLRKNEIMRLVGDPTKCNKFIGPELKTKTVPEILKDMVESK
ncbi:MAG: GDP-mannose 4,6-dehydratase [Alphaproteobacteria bacterium]|nr:GDP-mannose 4,6-dehydratase [Alphaproteobacteria bacterium]